MPMTLKSISIRKPEPYGRNAAKEYVAIAEVEGGTYHDSIKVTVDPERTQQIVDILAGAVAESMARAAGEFAEDIKARIAAAPLEHEKLPAPAASEQD